eukprot:Platyproteum_vivax@DN14673_c0_g1_i1.p2
MDTMDRRKDNVRERARAIAEKQMLASGARTPDVYSSSKNPHSMENKILCGSPAVSQFAVPSDPASARATMEAAARACENAQAAEAEAAAVVEAIPPTLYNLVLEWLY